MSEQRKLSELPWGLISGTATGLGASLGWAWRSWELFFVVSVVIALLIVWWIRR